MPVQDKQLVSSLPSLKKMKALVCLPAVPEKTKPSECKQV